MDTIFRDFDEEYYEEKTKLEDLINYILGDPDWFYKRVGEELTPKEREYIKTFIDTCCETCANGSCREELQDKIGLDDFGNPMGSDCLGWKNDRLVGKYKVLKLNRMTRKTGEKK